MNTVLISGAGIAGPTLAFWLRAAGFQPTLVERAAELRSGGYVIDFWGLGYDIAERMGLVTAINRAGYHAKELRIVDDRGRRVAGFGTKVFTEYDGRALRDAEAQRPLAVAFREGQGNTEVIFDNEIVSLDSSQDGVRVRLKHGGERQFDLVIGADGLHSAVRGLAFGPQQNFEKQLGYVVAAFEVAGYRPRDEDIYLMYGRAGADARTFHVTR